MKLGFLTGKYEDIAKASQLGFRGIELNVQGFGAPQTGPVDTAAVETIKKLAQENNIEITALAFYGVAGMAPDATNVTETYERVFDVADTLGVKVISSLSGFDSNRNWDGNVELFAKRFGPVAQAAEQRDIKIAFENWMGFGGCLPHRPVNMGGSPDTWDACFNAVPSKALGIEFDPSHLYWQGIDHIRALKEFRDRVYHVHAKDTEMFPEKRYRGGVNGSYYRFRIPGYGEINWPQFISALDEIGYTGGVAIEHEDQVYSGDRFDEGLVRGWQTLNPLISPSEK